MKSWSWGPHKEITVQDPDAGRDWGQEEKGTTEDEMAGWHHWLDGRESEWTLGAGDGQGGLACCDSWGLKESDTIERLNWTELNKKRKRLESSLSAMWEYSKKVVTCEPESGSSRDIRSAGAMSWGFPASRDVRHQYLFSHSA